MNYQQPSVPKKVYLTMVRVRLRAVLWPWYKLYWKCILDSENDDIFTAAKSATLNQQGIYIGTILFI